MDVLTVMANRHKDTALFGRLAPGNHLLTHFKVFSLVVAQFGHSAGIQELELCHSERI